MTFEPRAVKRARHLKPGTSAMSLSAVLLATAVSVLFPGAIMFLRGKRPSRWLALIPPTAMWAAGLFMALNALIDPSWALTLITHPTRSFWMITALLMSALWQVVALVDLCARVRLSRQQPATRAGTAAVLVAALLLTTVLPGYVAYLITVSRNALTDIFAGPDQGQNDTTPFLQPINRRYNFLLMGGDAGDDRAGRRPDSLMVVSVDATTGQPLLISIPRNFQNAPFPANSPAKKIFPNGYNCGDECIINSLYSTVNTQYSSLYPGVKDPGAQATVEAASGITGLTVQFYVMVDMDPFAAVIDMFGGVRLNIGGWVPISGAALDNVGARHLPPEGWIAPGNNVRLDGQQALWFVRSRQYVTDYARGERQRCAIQALLKQVDPLTVATKYAELLKMSAEGIESDTTPEQLSTFLGLAFKAREQPVSTLALGPPNFNDMFPTYPDFSLIRSEVQKRINPPSTPTTVPSSPDTRAQTPGGASEPNAPSASPPAASSPGATPGSSPSSTPTYTGPPLTEKYLQGLAERGDDATLTQLLANNGECSVPE